MKKGCSVAAELPDSVGGVEGEDQIVEKFKEVYSALYNSASTAEEVNTIKEKLSELINASSMHEVMKITGEKVKEAAGLLKLGKADVSEGFCSDAILNSPDILFEQLAGA